MPMAVQETLAGPQPNLKLEVGVEVKVEAEGKVEVGVGVAQDGRPWPAWMIFLRVFSPTIFLCASRRPLPLPHHLLADRAYH